MVICAKTPKCHTNRLFAWSRRIVQYLIVGKTSILQKLFSNSCSCLTLFFSLFNSSTHSSYIELCTCTCVHSDKKHINQLRRSAPASVHQTIDNELEDERERNDRRVREWMRVSQWQQQQQQQHHHHFVCLLDIIFALSCCMPAKYVDMAGKNGRIVIRQCLSRDANIYCITSHMWI